MEISQLTPVITNIGDSISNYAFDIRNLLKLSGFDSNIYVVYKDFFLPNFIKYYKDYKPNEDDIIILHATIGSKLTDFFRGLKCKKIIIYHNYTPANFFKNLDGEKYTLLKNYEMELKSLIDSTDCVLADSEFNRLDLLKIGFKDVKVLPIFVNFNRFNESNQEIINNFDDGYVNIIYVGRISPNKKIEDLIKIFYYYKNFINYKSRLFLIGTMMEVPIYYESLLKYIEKLKLKDILFTNKVTDKDLTSYYKISDVLLHMSEHEGFGIPLIEAMYLNIPIIAFNSTAVPYTLENSGILVNEKNYKKIAELIGLIQSNKGLKERILKSQKNRLKHFENDRLKKELLQHIINLKNSNIKYNLTKNKSETKELKILYVLPGGIGDIIMSTPIFRALKNKYKNAEIDFLTTDYCKDILIGNSHISKIFTDESSVNFQEYFQVFRPYIKTQLIPDWQNNGKHIVDLYALLCGVELDNYKTEIYPVKISLKDYGVNENEDYICLHTKSSLRSKDWPYFKELIEILKDEFKIVVIDEQQHNYFGTIQLPKNMKLTEKAFIVSKCKMLIGVDSMGIHTSCAFGIPTIAIYGNTLPELCRPLSNNNLITIKPKKICTDGWHHKCKENNYCIDNISVEDILQKIEEILSKCKIY